MIIWYMVEDKMIKSSGDSFKSDYNLALPLKLTNNLIKYTYK